MLIRIFLPGLDAVAAEVLATKSARSGGFYQSRNNWSRIVIRPESW
jgi:hypothetical protein